MNLWFGKCILLYYKKGFVLQPNIHYSHEGLWSWCPPFATVGPIASFDINDLNVYAHDA
jgi:hypothetical protein